MRNELNTGAEAKFAEISQLPEQSEIKLTQPAETTDFWNQIDDLFEFDDLSTMDQNSILGGKYLPNDIFQVKDSIYYTNENGQIVDYKSANEVSSERNGGSYKEVKAGSDGSKYEVHHTPADSASKLDRADGPAIKMEKEDHQQTASWGMSREAREYRDIQRDLIEQGKFREALQMDIDDIREKFGDKYDDSISEMLEYVDKLEKAGEI